MRKEELESKLANIEKELKRLEAILNKDPEEYAEELRREYGKNWRESDTYPYKVGIASATIENILKENFKENKK